MDRIQDTESNNSSIVTCVFLLTPLLRLSGVKGEISDRQTARWFLFEIKKVG